MPGGIGFRGQVAGQQFLASMSALGQKQTFRPILLGAVTYLSGLLTEIERSSHSGFSEPVSDCDWGDKGKLK